MKLNQGFLLKYTYYFLYFENICSLILGVRIFVLCLYAITALSSNKQNGTQVFVWLLNWEYAWSWLI